MSKTFLSVIILAVILAVAFAYFGGSWQNKEKIHEAELEMLKLRFQKDSLETVVAYRDSLASTVENQITLKQDEVGLLREEVRLLEEERKENQLSVRKLNKRVDLQNKFQETFPEVASSDWGVTEVFNEEQGVGIEYFLIPAWFSETFIIDHNNSISFEAQKHKLVQVDSLHTLVDSLQDSVLVLERLNRFAYEEGYNYAFAKYEDLNQKYIGELQKGKIDWGWQAAGFVGGGIIGVLIGRGTK